MKKITILSTVLVLLLSFQSFGQEEKEVYATVNSLGFEVNTLKELKSINWNDMIAMFKENAPQDSIAVSVKVKDLKLNNKNNLVIDNMKVLVTGISENKKAVIEQLAEKTDRMVKAIERMTE